MCIDRLRIRIVAGLAAVLLGGLFGGAAARAQKGGGWTPPPPPVPPGTIYFSGLAPTSGNDSSAAPMSMKGDGTDKRKALSYLAPSYQRHADSRWFLLGDYDWDGPVDEWGFPLAYELYAVNEQGRWVQLTADPNVHWGGWIDEVAWGKDDSFVSYGAWWFTGNGDEVRGGLFYVDIDWSSGDPVAGPPTFLVEAEAYWFHDWVGDVNVGAHDWSPDGSAVVFETEEDTGTVLYVADFSGEQTRINWLADASAAVWSPDGSRIAYSGGGIWTIKPDGTNPVRLTQRIVTNTEERAQATPSWSPDGAYIAYTEAVLTRRKQSYSVYRIPSGGGTAVSLTGDLVKASYPRWRP
jgi:hypothetical protein